MEGSEGDIVPGSYSTCQNNAGGPAVLGELVAGSEVAAMKKAK